LVHAWNWSFDSPYSFFKKILRKVIYFCLYILRKCYTNCSRFCWISQNPHSIKKCTF